MKSSFKEDDASCATVYFSTSEENWAESSEIALFNSSEKIEISVNLVQELLVYVSLGIFIFGSPLLYMVDTFCEKKRDRETAISPFLLGFGTGMYVWCLWWYLTGQVMMIRMRRQLFVSTVKVQLARPVNLKGTEKADVLKFDIKKVVRNLRKT
ncbi:hypothetical protein V1504DRAFT_447627 [Lipomyces starkeyi]